MYCPFQLTYYYVTRGAAALLLAGWTSDLRVKSSNPVLDNSYRVIALFKLFTPMWFSHKAV